jgi:CheY-like chemotaxis protein
MPHIFILENDAERISAMKEALAERLPNVESTFITNAPDAIVWLKNHFDHVSLISLDHDLGAESVRDGRPFDPGRGRDVCEYLAQLTPRCHVILHTDNFFVRPTMQGILDQGGWKHTFVAPGNRTWWVGEVWIQRVVEFLG